MLKSITGYIKDTRTPVYSFIAIFPLIILYDILVLLTKPNYVARAGLWADWFLSLVRINTVFGKIAFVTLVFLFFAFISLRNKKTQIRAVYFPVMVIESIFYAYFFSNAVFFIKKSLMLSVFSSSDGLVLSIGAGFYEELFFRFIPMMILRLSVKNGDKKTILVLVTILTSSLLFSIFHYIGPEAFSFESFIYRFISSVILFIIFITRGFGIAVYTHTIYDLMCFY